VPHPLLVPYPVAIPIPVQWGEMDAYGHVNNSVFFRYFETARMAYLERCGFLETHARDGVGAILHSTHCRFRQALVHPDTVEVGTRVSDLQDDRFTMSYVVVSTASGKVAAEGSAIIVAFDYRARAKVTLPDAVRAKILAIEGGTIPAA